MATVRPTGTHGGAPRVVGLGSYAFEKRAVCGGAMVCAVIDVAAVALPYCDYSSQEDSKDGDRGSHNGCRDLSCCPNHHVG